MSANHKQRLELTWIGKENRPKLEPRILLEDPEKSYHAPHRVTGRRHLRQPADLRRQPARAEGAGAGVRRQGQVRLHRPAVQHRQRVRRTTTTGWSTRIWLSLMRDRLEIIRRLLSEDGSLWITIDDNEAHYLKVLCDEVFGRDNFVANVIWEKAYSPRMRRSQFFSDSHDYILSTRTPKTWKIANAWSAA